MKYLLLFLRTCFIIVIFLIQLSCMRRNFCVYLNNDTDETFYGRYYFSKKEDNFNLKFDENWNKAQNSFVDHESICPPDDTCNNRYVWVGIRYTNGIAFDDIVIDTLYRAFILELNSGNDYYSITSEGIVFSEHY